MLGAEWLVSVEVEKSVESQAVESWKLAGSYWSDYYSWSERVDRQRDWRQ